MKFEIGRPIKKLVFMGHNIWATTALRALLNKGYQVSGVVCETDEFDRLEQENYKKFAAFGAYEYLKAVALDLGLEVVQPADVHSREFMDWLEKKSPDLILMSSYHAIIKKPLLEKFTFINMHGAPLPRYRGRSPFNWAIINNEKRHGISVFMLEEGIDTGPIICQRPVEIKFEERAIDIIIRCIHSWAELALEALEKLQTKGFQPAAQDLTQGCYFPKRFPEDGVIDWKNESSLTIYNKVRSLSYPYPGAYTFFKGEKIIFNRARMADNSRIITPVPGIVFSKSIDGAAKVSTRDGWIELTEVIWNGEIMPPFKILKMGTRF